MLFCIICIVLTVWSCNLHCSDCCNFPICRFEMAAQLGEREFRSITSNNKKTGRKLAAIEALKDLKKI